MLLASLHHRMNNRRHGRRTWQAPWVLISSRMAPCLSLVGGVAAARDAYLATLGVPDNPSQTRYLATVGPLSDKGPSRWHPMCRRHTSGRSALGGPGFGWPRSRCVRGRTGFGRRQGDGTSFKGRFARACSVTTARWTVHHVFRCACSWSWSRSRLAALFQGDVGTFLRQFEQEVEPVVLECYAECQALGVV